MLEARSLVLTLLVHYNDYMSTLTIRIDPSLKDKASKEAEKLGVSLSLIIKNGLQNFVDSPKVIIGEAQTVIVDAETQKKMDIIGELLS